MAWLADGRSCKDKELHDLLFIPTLGERAKGRENLKKMKGSTAFFDAEREQRAGEPEEWPTMEGLDRNYT